MAGHDGADGALDDLSNSSAITGYISLDQPIPQLSTNLVSGGPEG
jgi:hypothetical protein